MNGSTFSRSALCCAVACLLAALVAACNDGTSHVLGSGTTLPDPSPIVEKTYPLSGAQAVRMDGIGRVFVRQGSSQSLVVRTEELILPHIRVQIVNGELQLGFFRPMSFAGRNPTIEFHVTLASLDRVELEGVGKITLEQIETPSLELALEGVGEIVAADLDVTTLDVTQNGVGGITVSGTARSQYVDMNGVGDYDARDLASETAELYVRGLGSATVSVSDQLTAHLLSSGCVYYVGSPQVIVDRSGSGTCQQIP